MEESNQLPAKEARVRLRRIGEKPKRLPGLQVRAEPAVLETLGLLWLGASRLYCKLHVKLPSWPAAKLSF